MPYVNGQFVAFIPYGDEPKENMWSIDIFGKLTDQDVCIDDLNLRCWGDLYLGIPNRKAVICGQCLSAWVKFLSDHSHPQGSGMPHAFCFLCWYHS